MGLFGKKKPRERPVSNSTRTRVGGRRQPSRHQIRTLWRNSAQHGPVTVDGDLLENMLIWLLYYEMMTPDQESIGMNDVWTDLETSGEWAQLQDSNSVETVEPESEVVEASATEAELEQIESAINTVEVKSEQVDYDQPQTSTPAYDPPPSMDDEITRQTSVSSGGGFGGGYDDGGGGGYDSGGSDTSSFD